MFAAQLAVSALAWAATVVLLVRRREALLARMAREKRGTRALLALGGLVAGVAVLGLGMTALALGGLTPRGLTLWAWPLVTLAGAAFVVLQTAALVPLVLNAVEPVTPRRRDSSETPDADRP